MVIAIVLIVILILSNIVMFLNAKTFHGLWLRQRNKYNGVNRNFLFLNEWMDKKRKNPMKLENTLKEKKCMQVAIYGAGYIGQQLYRELVSSGIKVVCIIDKRKDREGVGVPCYTLSDELPWFEAVIVSVVYDYGKIEDELKKVTDAQIFFLEELL